VTFRRLPLPSNHRLDGIFHTNLRNLHIEPTGFNLAGWHFRYPLIYLIKKINEGKGKIFLEKSEKRFKKFGIPIVGNLSKKSMYRKSIQTLLTWKSERIQENLIPEKSNSSIPQNLIKINNTRALKNVFLKIYLNSGPRVSIV